MSGVRDPRGARRARPASWRARAIATMLPLLIALLGAFAPLDAQGPDPRRSWRTIATPHFRVHYSEGLEAEARRAAGHAEWAWTRLAAELVPPRGPVDLVVADNVDYTQGYATTFPTNRIVVFTQPPVDGFALRFHGDWSQFVITHELTHIFHRDRSRGIWSALQRVMGRSPILFPNAYAPAWITEGLAVYYESRLTGAGRLSGTEHRLIARAAAAEGHVPRLDELSQAASVFPGGTRAYAYGSLVFEELARSRGAGRVRDFVERQSGLLIPFRLDDAARRSFGVSFSDAWERWRDSVERALAPVAQRAAAGGTGWRELTREGWYAAYPRWRDSTHVLYAANDGREVGGVYEVGLDGERRRVGRRNTLTGNVPLADGGLLFSQLEYVDPFTVRSDLWVQRDARGVGADFGAGSRGERRLTRGARLAQPDARADGEIVAVQSGFGTTWLARVSRDGARVTPLTRAVRDTQWTEPRWSPDGSRVVAVALTPGARSSVVVLDTVGRVTDVVVAERAVNVAPSWSTDGRRVYWSSDRTGAPQVYAAELRAEAPATVTDGGEPGRVRRLSDVPTGLVQPSAAPGTGMLAALLFRGDGYHLATGDAGAATGVPASADSSVYLAPVAGLETTPADGPSTAYRPWRTLVPRYWLPIAAPSDGGALMLGAGTSGRDVVERHTYSAQVTLNLETGDVEGNAAYRFAGLGQPAVELGASQSWTYDTVGVRLASDGAVEPYPLFRRTRQASLALELVRPRMRTGASLSVGALLERRAYTSPAPAVVALANDRLGRTFPGVFASAGWSNTRRPVRSISPEDGVALSGTVQQRWQEGRLGPWSRRAVGTARAYKSLDLPGFAHHVLAARIAGGYADARSATEFDAGGVSGTLSELVPGVVVGDPARTFGVRGFPAGAQTGLRAAAGSVEYRAPLVVAARGARLLPVFLDRLSIAAFADAASAWCPREIARAAQPLCAESLAETPTGARWLASAGGELGLDASLAYDVPYRFRLGAAAPVRERTRASRAVSVYFTLGTAF